MENALAILHWHTEIEDVKFVLGSPLIEMSFACHSEHEIGHASGTSTFIHVTVFGPSFENRLSAYK